jgi:hypothetical protein
MKFFLDENFPKTVEKLVTLENHEIIDIGETKQIGSRE